MIFCLVEVAISSLCALFANVCLNPHNICSWNALLLSISGVGLLVLPTTGSISNLEMIFGTFVMVLRINNARLSSLLPLSTSSMLFGLQEIRLGSNAKKIVGNLLLPQLFPIMPYQVTSQKLWLPLASLTL